MITGPEPSGIAGSGHVITARGERCFFCGEATEDPAVMWSGATGEIFLHPPCFPELMIRGSRDLLELEHRSGGRLAWRPDERNQGAAPS